MRDSVRSSVEKFWKSELDSYISNMPIFVSRRDEKVEWDDSYAVVRVDDMEGTWDTDEVYYVDVQVWLISHIDDAETAKHEEQLRCLKEAINAIHDKYRWKFPFNSESGARVYGWSNKRVSESEFDQAWGDVIYLDNCGFGLARGSFTVAPVFENGPATTVDSSVNYVMKKLWNEDKKIDASQGAVTVRIPANTITFGGYSTTPGKVLRVTDSSGSDILDPGEQVNRPQINLPEGLGVYDEAEIHFELGSRGTVSYVADRNLGPITVVNAE